jgi:hypothetical protein
MRFSGEKSVLTFSQVSIHKIYRNVKANRKISHSKTTIWKMEICGSKFFEWIDENMDRKGEGC